MAQRQGPCLAACAREGASYQKRLSEHLLNKHKGNERGKGPLPYLDVFALSLLLAGGRLPLVGRVGTQGTPDSQPGKGVQEKGVKSKRPRRGFCAHADQAPPDRASPQPSFLGGPGRVPHSRLGGLKALHKILLGESGARGVHEAVPLGGVGEQTRQDVAQQDQGHLLHVQTEDGVEQLHRPQRVLLPRLLQQLLEGRGRGGPRS